MLDMEHIVNVVNGGIQTLIFKYIGKKISLPLRKNHISYVGFIFFFKAQIGKCDCCCCCYCCFFQYWTTNYTYT